MEELREGAAPAAVRLDGNSIMLGVVGLCSFVCTVRAARAQNTMAYIFFGEVRVNFGIDSEKGAL
jgi:hypothetical protein